MKTVGFGVLRREVRNVSINHPFSDDAEWERLLGDAQHGQDVWVGKAPPDRDFLEQTLPRVVKGAHRVQNCWRRTFLILDMAPFVWVRNALIHTRFPLRWPFQTSANPPEANAMSSSLVIFPEIIQE